MTTLFALVALALPFVVSPGASFTLTIRAAVEGDHRSPLKVWAGTSLGIALIAAVAGATGLGTFVANNDTVRLLFGAVGGALLITFGAGAAVKALWRQGNGPGNASAPQRRLVLWAFVIVISNVKALSLYALIVPSAPRTGLTGAALYAAFAGIHIIMLLIWLSLLGLGVRRFPVLTRSPQSRRVLVGGAGVMMLLLGVRSIVDAFSTQV